MRTIKTSLALLALVLVATTSARAERFETKKGDYGNSAVSFEISAPLETIVGTSASVSGYFDFNPKDVMKSKKGMFKVKVGDFNTGIDLRDEHFRDRYLHTGKYPTATYTLEKIVKASRNTVKSSESVKLEVEGTFDLHGVKRKERVTVVATYMKESDATKGVMAGDLLAIKADFRVKLADYNIERPEMLVLRVGEAVDISFSSRLTNQPHAKGGGCGDCGCDGCGCGGCGCDGGCGCGGCDGGCGGCDGGCGGCDGGCGGCGGCGD